jgi:hypothetical protein
VTALTDGFLFQTLEENVGASETMAGRLEYLRELIDLTLTGLIPALKGSLHP